MNLLNNVLFQELKKLNLHEDEYIIFGSGIMFALGLRPLEDLNDIDLFVTTNGWSKVKNLATIQKAESWKCSHVQLANDRIDIYNGWGPGSYNITELIKNSVKISGFNFASPEDTIRWKKEMGREKDLKHIKMITDYLESNKKI